MKRQDLIKKKLPDAPGVYFFLGRPSKRDLGLGSRKPESGDRAGKILYIGRATSLRSRVRSYFDARLADTRGPAIVVMVEEARGVRYEQTDSVLEALILEANLIKKHQPKYNTKEKSDKSFNYIVITKEDFPRVLLMRERELLLKTKNYKLITSIGPFPHGSVLREALKIVRKIFPFRDKCTPYGSPYGSQTSIGSKRGCFNRQIGLCPGVCTGR